MLVTFTTDRGQGWCVFWRLAKSLACALLLPLLFPLGSAAAEFTVTQISDETRINREPVISETGLAAWAAYTKAGEEMSSSDIFVYYDGKARPITKSKLDPEMVNLRPCVHSNSVVWVGTFHGAAGPVDWVLREVPSPGRDEPTPELRADYEAHEAPDGRQWFTLPGTGQPPTQAEGGTNAPPAEPQPAPAADTAPPAAAPADTNAPAPTPPPSTPPPSGPFVEPPPDLSKLPDAARRAPSGDTEICLWKKPDSEIMRITRDGRDDLGPSFWGSLIAWQKAKGWPFGWEVMIWSDGARAQLTTNYYYDMAPKVHGSQVVWYGWDGHDFEIFLYDDKAKVTTQITSNQYDDVSPVLWGGVIAWEGYAGVDGDIFMWKDGKIEKISDNIEDDLNPRIWNGQVVWQGFDGDDFEIYLYDGTKTLKLTSNTHDDLNPDIADGLICWMGYHDNWDAEIFVWDGTDVKRLTENEYEDRDPRTAGGRVIWQQDQGDKSLIFLAEPK